MYDNHGIIHLLSCSSTCISVALEERYVGYRRVRRLVGLKFLLVACSRCLPQFYSKST